MNKDGKNADGKQVGYGNPPDHGKFKPGQSGNPSGKKKGKGLAHYLAEVGEAEKTVSLGGQVVTMPANEAVAQKVYADALKGKPHATKIILDSQKGFSGTAPGAEGLLVGAEEIEVARTHAEWLKLIEDVKGDHADDDASE